MNINDVAARNPLVLAFVGDAYWTLFVRTMLIKKSQAKVNKLHIEANKYVCAISQSGFYNKILPFLTEVETGIAGRARNADSHTRPKNCTLSEYKLATAFEAIVGFNVLVGNYKRLTNLFDIMFDSEDKNAN